MQHVSEDLQVLDYYTTQHELKAVKNRIELCEHEMETLRKEANRLETALLEKEYRVKEIQFERIEEMIRHGVREDGEKRAVYAARCHEYISEYVFVADSYMDISFCEHYPDHCWNTISFIIQKSNNQQEVISFKELIKQPNWIDSIVAITHLFCLEELFNDETEWLENLSDTGLALDDIPDDLKRKPQEEGFYKVTFNGVPVTSRESFLEHALRIDNCYRFDIDLCDEFEFIPTE